MNTTGMSADLTPTHSTFECIRRFDELNHKAILERIGHVCPEAFQCGIEGVDNPFTVVDSFYAEVIACLFPVPGLPKQKVQAIKDIRHKFGLGLKEAKDVTDWLDGMSNSSKLEGAALRVFNAFLDTGFKPVPAPVLVPEKIGTVYVLSYKHRNSMSDEWTSKMVSYVAVADVADRAYDMRRDPDYYCDVSVVTCELKHNP